MKKIIFITIISFIVLPHIKSQWAQPHYGIQVFYDSVRFQTVVDKSLADHSLFINEWNSTVGKTTGLSLLKITANDSLMLPYLNDGEILYINGAVLKKIDGFWSYNGSDGIVIPIGDKIYFDDATVYISEAPSVNNLTIHANGTNYIFKSDRIETGINNTFFIKSSASTSTAPLYVFRGSITSGLGLVDIDEPNISAGGVSMVSFDEGDADSIKFYVNMWGVGSYFRLDSIICVSTTYSEGVIRSDSILVTGKLTSEYFLGQLYIDSDLVIDIITADTDQTVSGWEDAGTWSYAENTTLTDSSITIGPTANGFYEVLFEASSLHSASNQEIHYHLFVNDVEITAMETETRIGPGTDIQVSSASALIFLNNSDELKIKVKSTSDANMTIQHANFHVKRL